MGKQATTSNLDKALEAIYDYGDENYQLGLTKGLAVAEKIIGWLTRQPDTKRQRETREWAIKAVAAARERVSG